MFTKGGEDKVSVRGGKSRKTLKSRKEIATAGEKPIKGGGKRDKQM